MIFSNGMALYQERNDGKLHPVAFDSYKLQGIKVSYLAHEKELLIFKDTF